MVKSRLIVTVFFIPILLRAETALDRYVQEGLESNLAFKQGRFSCQGSLQALKEARSSFFPTVSVSSRYSRADGGRTIDLPIGDLINPMHDALNTLLASHGEPASFPANIANESIPIVPETEQDTKLRLTQPIFNSRIINGYRVQKSMTASEEAALAAFRNQLVREIKSAYYTYLKARKVVELYEATRPLLEENLRVSERLVSAQAATEEVVFRSRAELAGLDRATEEAKKDRDLASAYFNFLLNRSLDSPIHIAEGKEAALAEPPELSTLEEHALAHRPDLRQLQWALRAAESSIALAAGERLPSLTGVLDFGFQGESYHFGPENDYWTASLLFEWELFDGLGNAARRKQAEYERDKLKTGLLELENHIRLKVREAYRAVTVAGKAIESSADRMASQEKTFEIIRRKYESGLVNQVEYIETRTDLTDAEIHHILARYDYHIRLAELEEAAALYER
jgi:outer membrane protein